MELKDEIIAYLAVEEQGEKSEIKDAVGDYEDDFDKVMESLKHERTVKEEDGVLKLTENSKNSSDVDDEFGDLEQA